MRRIITITMFLTLLIGSCVIGPQTFNPVIYEPPKPKYIIICEPTPDNGLYIWRKECVVLVRQ